MDSAQILEDTLMSTQYISKEGYEECASKEKINWLSYRELTYYEKDNRFVDEWGNIIHDIYNIITPNDLQLFKKNKQYHLARGVQGQYVELIWPSFPAELDF